MTVYFRGCRCEDGPLQRDGKTTTRQYCRLPVFCREDATTYKVLAKTWSTAPATSEAWLWQAASVAGRLMVQTILQGSSSKLLDGPFGIRNRRMIGTRRQSTVSSDVKFEAEAEVKALIDTLSFEACLVVVPDKERINSVDMLSLLYQTRWSHSPLQSV